MTINELADLVADAAGIKVRKKHIRRPAGSARTQFRQYALARGSSLAAAKFRSKRAWRKTYRWIEAQVRRQPWTLIPPEFAGSSRARVTRQQNFFGRLVVASGSGGAVGELICWLTRVRFKLWQLGYPVLPIGSARSAAWIITVMFPAWVIALRYFRLYSPITYRSTTKSSAAIVQGPNGGVGSDAECGLHHSRVRWHQSSVAGPYRSVQLCRTDG